MKKPKLANLDEVIKTFNYQVESTTSMDNPYPVTFYKGEILKALKDKFDDVADMVNLAKALEEVRKIFSPILPAGNNLITIEEGDGVIALSQKNLGLGTIREIINRHGAHPIYMVEFKEGVHVPYNESEIEIQYVHHEPY